MEAPNPSKFLSLASYRHISDRSAENPSLTHNTDSDQLTDAAEELTANYRVSGEARFGFFPFSCLCSLQLDLFPSSAQFYIRH